MKNFSEECLVGSGTLGNVYKGTFDTKGILATQKGFIGSFGAQRKFIFETN